MAAAPHDRKRVDARVERELARAQAMIERARTLVDEDDEFASELADLATAAEAYRQEFADRAEVHRPSRASESARGAAEGVRKARAKKKAKA